MRSEFLSFSLPYIGEEEIQEVIDTLRSDWVTTGPKTKTFEKEFAAFVGAEEALALNSCTAGLHISLLTKNIGVGDEVITTPMTFAASVNVIEHVGAKPILVDIEKDTLNIDAHAIEAAITPQTKAILVVHYSGHPVDMDTISKIASKYNLAIIEDAAHALPAKYNGSMIGQSANLTSFSFYANKNLTTAEGGMLTGNKDEIEKARILSLHGMNRDAWKRFEKSGSWRYDIVFPGFKYNMTDIQASLGLWQLRKLSETQEKRKAIVNIYQEKLSSLNCLELPVTRDNVEHSWHLYVIKLKLDQFKISRDEFIEILKEYNIGTSVHYIPIHMHSYYANKYGYSPTDFPNAYEAHNKIISLPLSPKMTSDDATYVSNCVADICAKYHK